MLFTKGEIHLFCPNVTTACDRTREVTWVTFCRSYAQGSYISLEFLRKHWNLPSNFPNLEKVWRMETKSGKMVKSLEFIFIGTASKGSFIFFWSNHIQSCPYILLCIVRKALSLFFLRSVLIRYLITLSLIWKKKLLFWKKVWKRSWILDPKICTNPVCCWPDRTPTPL